MMVYDIFKKSLISSWPTLIIVTVTLLAVRIGYFRHHHTKFSFYKEFWTLVAAVYLILLYDLITNVELNKLSGFNIMPFTEIFRYKFGSDLFLFNVIGNIGMFVPVGFIIAYYIKPKNGWSNILIGIVISATIELVQLNIGRSFDIDDIILNTLGCIIGYLFYIALKAVLNHLPKFFRSDWFNNLICIIITICLIIYFVGIKKVGI